MLMNYHDLRTGESSSLNIPFWFLRLLVRDHLDICASLKFLLETILRTLLTQIPDDDLDAVFALLC